jgi:mannosylglucosylglycerate synthase
MHIALLHYSAPPIIGGVESVLATHARLMTAAGHHVTILAGRGDGRADPNVDVHIMPRIDSRHPSVLEAKAALDGGKVPDGFGELVRDILDNLRATLRDVDVLIPHNVASLHKNLALTAALHTLSQAADGPRTVLWHHDLAWTTPRYAAELHAGWPWDLLRVAWPGARQVVVSELRRAELADLMDLSPESIAVVPNGVDPSTFLGLHADTVALVENLYLLAAAPILLMPVRLTRRKNVELALQILAALHEAMPGAALVVTGPPGPHNPSNAEYLAQLRKLRVDLGLDGAAHLLADFHPEGLTDTVVADFYRVADALLMPSREEGFGIPILEAGLAGLPVFCADIPPLRALVGELGMLFSPDADPRRVATIIAERLSSDPVYCMRVRARHEYTWGAIYHRHIAPLLQP